MLPPSDADTAVRLLADAALLQRIDNTLRSTTPLEMDLPHKVACVKALQDAARRLQLDFLVEFEAEPIHATIKHGEKFASIFIACAHFLLAISLNATEMLFGNLSLEHCSETAPSWIHASTQELETELAQFLSEERADTLCESLDALRCLQESMTRPSFANNSQEAWKFARSVLDRSCGPARGSCAGLKSTLYAPPNRFERDTLGGFRSITLSANAEAIELGNSAHCPWLLTLHPPLMLEESELQRIQRICFGNGQFPIDDESLPVRAPIFSSLSDWLSANDSTGRVRHLLERENMDEGGVHRCLHNVPINSEKSRQIHLWQQWEVTSASAVGIVIENLPLKNLEALSDVLTALRCAAYFAQAWASALIEPLLPESYTLVSKDNNFSDDVYRIELRISPPTCMSLLLLLPCSSSSSQYASQLVELRYEICSSENVSDGSEFNRCLPRWRASIVCANGGDCAVPSSYAATLLNACHSLPLTLSHLRQRAMDTVLDTCWGEKT